MIHRRRFLAGAATALVAARLPRVYAAASDDRPNILFCIADDWGWPHAGVYGDRVVQTPTLDRLAREGALFNQSYCAAPTCTASRAAILTGQMPHRLDEGANLHGFLPGRFRVYPDLLEAAGYAVGLKGKGWGPGNAQAGGWKRNPAGPAFKDFATFLEAAPRGKPFCFWFGSSDPHRTYEPGSGKASGMKLEDVVVPPYFPDTPEVRSDILDYYFEVRRFDRDVNQHLELLEKNNLVENTIVVMTSDNGWPFPRGKANLYEYGTHMPLAIRWPRRIRPRTVIEDFVSHTDFAPTFLEAADLKVPPDMTGRSLMPLFDGTERNRRDGVFTERERHANVRQGDLSYPARALHTRDFVYIRNLRPDRWPAGDPDKWKAVGAYGDIDGGPTKEIVLTAKDAPGNDRFFQLACGKRPAEELYDRRKDPYQIDNVARRPEYATVQAQLRARMDAWMESTADPRVNADDDRFDKFPYFGK